MEMWLLILALGMFVLSLFLKSMLFCVITIITMLFVVAQNGTTGDTAIWIQVIFGFMAVFEFLMIIWRVKRI